jgi:hypothetical protein
VTMNSMMKILYRVRISQDQLFLEPQYFTTKSIDCQRSPPPILRLGSST